MSNTATININSPSGTHQVFLEQDADVKRTDHAVLRWRCASSHGCSANGDGTAFKGNTAIRVFFMMFNDVVSVGRRPDVQRRDDGCFRGQSGLRWLSERRPIRGVGGFCAGLFVAGFGGVIHFILGAICAVIFMVAAIFIWAWWENMRDWWENRG